MRSDNTVTYLDDGGGFNLPFDKGVMQNIAAPGRNPAPEFFHLLDKRERDRYATTEGTFVWLVVAPCVKRAVVQGMGNIG